MMNTWRSREEMQRGLQLMLQGNPYFAWQDENGIYKPCYALHELEQYQGLIFEGLKTPGFYSITQNNTTTWGGLDFDSHGEKIMDWKPKAEEAFNALSSKVDESWFLETHPGGFHVLAFVNDFVAAKEIRTLLSEYAPSHIEIFPKQDQLKEKPNAKGNLLRFPGRHQKKGNWGKFLSRSGQATPAKITHDQPSRSSQSKIEGFYNIATRGIYLTDVGQRYNAMQKIVGRLKGRASEEEAIQIHRMWYNRYSLKISTDFKESLRQFVGWFRDADPCQLEIPEYEPSEEEQLRISNLPKLPDIRPETLCEVAKLFLKVQRHAERRGLDECWLSCQMIAKELSISIPTASRYRMALVQMGFVELLKRGRTGLASTYRIKQ